MINIFRTTTLNYDFTAKVIKAGTYVHNVNGRLFTLEDDTGLLGTFNNTRVVLVATLAEDNRLWRLIKK